jgi:putative oxidoreductase
MSTTLSGKANLVSWASRLIAAAIMGQTLFFKFTAAPEAVALFETLGAEPWGRIATGVLEAIAVVLLLLPRTAALGGALTLGLMGGAIMSHLTLLGIEVGDDGGALFIMALVTLAAGTVTTWLHRAELPIVGARFPSKH